MTTTTAPHLIARTTLFGNPERVAPRLSPDGQHLAWIAPHEGVLNIWVCPADADPAQARVITDDRDRGIRSYFWAPDDARILYVQDTGGDENWRLYDVELASGKIRDLTPYDGVQVQVVGLENDITDKVVIAMNHEDARLHDLYELDLASGVLTLVLKNPGYVGFTTDLHLQVRAALAPQPDGSTILMLRESGSQEWKPALTIGHEESLTTRPITFNDDGDRLLMISSVGANAARLQWMDVATGEVEVLAEDPGYDVADAWLDERTRQPLAVAFLRDRLTWQVLEPGFAAQLEAVTSLDGGDVHFLSRTRDDKAWVLATDHADGPTRYYVYRPGAAAAGEQESAAPSGTGQLLFVNRPELSQETLAPMEPFSFETRDGLTVHGYLTVPPGAVREGLPAVLNVHGGPWARDAWGFDPQAQWLANRGYVCIQVNFRGSTGYGKGFLNAGDREWGARMHDDLLDAVAHVAGTGLIDPARVAIYGGSYGGYAALVGAAFTPDVFCAAVDIVGPSNLATLIGSIPPYWEPLIAQFHQRVGNPETEADFMWSRSPLSKVDNITIPLLIAQGANDPRVKQAESEQIVAELIGKGIPHRYLLFEDEGHGFAKPENRLAFYAEAERFLAEHVGGRCES